MLLYSSGTPKSIYKMLFIQSIVVRQIAGGGSTDELRLEMKPLRADHPDRSAALPDEGTCVCRHSQLIDCPFPYLSACGRGRSPPSTRSRNATASRAITS